MQAIILVEEDNKEIRFDTNREIESLERSISLTPFMVFAAN